MNEQLGKTKVTIRIETDGYSEGSAFRGVVVAKSLINNLGAAIPVATSFLPEKLTSSADVIDFFKTTEQKHDFSNTEIELYIGRKPTTQAERFANKDYLNGYMDCKRDIDFAIQLRAQRESKGWSVLRLCKEAKVPQKIIRELESGNMDNATLNVFADLSNALDIAVDIRFTSIEDSLKTPIPLSTVSTFKEEVKNVKIVESGFAATKALVTIKPGTMISLVDSPNKEIGYWPKIVTSTGKSLQRYENTLFTAHWIKQNGPKAPYWFCEGLEFGAEHNPGFGHIAAFGYNNVEIIKKLE